jgi:hypothetical protein
MCYKNFALLGLKYKMHAGLQVFRPAGALIQNACGSTSISPRWGSYTKMLFYCSAFQLQRSGILVEIN